MVQSSDRLEIDLEHRVVVRPLAAGGSGAWNRWTRAGCGAATVVLGWMCWFGQGTLQPMAATAPLAQPARVLTGSSNETLDVPSSARETRAERAQRRKARKEAARAKRAAARELRASKAQARRAASQEKREAARERHAAAAQVRRESADERRAARMAKHEGARERHAAALQAKREAAEARREAAREKRELAKAQRESAAEAKANSLASNPRHAGVLRINSLPWSQVFIDGQMVGYTPQRSISLKPGEHAVRLINPEFAMSKTLQVRIAKGEQLTRVEMLSE